MAGKKSQFLKNFTKQQKITFLIVGIIFAIVVIYSLITLFSRIGKVATTIQFAPYTATVTINGEKVDNKSTKYLIPGEYTIVVEAEHFETFTNTVTISKDYHYMVGILNAADDEGANYQSTHAFEFAEVEGLVGVAMNAEGAVRKKNHPILNYLPINNSLFSISYEYDTDNVTPIISVKTTALYLDDAVAKLKTLKNVDLTSYEIVFKVQNPFAIYDEKITADKPIDCVEKSFNLPEKYVISEGQDLTDNYYLIQLYIDDYDLDYKYSHYKVLLHKDENNMWKIVTSPQPLFTQKNTPNVPKEILDTANSF